MRALPLCSSQRARSDRVLFTKARVPMHVPLPPADFMYVFLAAIGVYAFKCLDSFQGKRLLVPSHADGCQIGCRDFYNEREALLFARNALRAGQSAQQVADGLVDRALKRYTADNVAIVVIKFPWSLKSDVRGVRLKPKSKKKRLFGML